MTVEVSRAVDRSEWSRFVDEQAGGNIFHRPEMFDVFARADGFAPEVWAARDNGVIRALITPVQVQLFGGHLEAFTTRAVLYGSVLCEDSEPGRAALAALLRRYAAHARRSAVFVELRNLVDVSGLAGVLRSCGYQFEPHLDFLIDLDRPPDAILQAIGTRTRAHIRRGLRAGRVQIEEARTQSELEECYRLLRLTYERARIPLASPSLFEAAHAELVPRGMARFLLARVNGAAAGCVVELVYRDRVYHWYAGSDRAYAAETPGELLIWNVLEWAATAGYRVFDFGGAGRPNEPYGPRDFKAKFGGQLVEFGRYTWTPSPFRLRLSQFGYGMYRRVRGRPQ